MRRKAADIDGIGRGQPEGKLHSLTLGENLLYTGLGIVKIATDGANGYIFPLLAHHLTALDLGYAAVGIEDTNPNARYIFKALQSGFAGITGGGGEN